MKLADAQTNMRAVQQEEQELSAEDKAIQAAGREYKAKHVSYSSPGAFPPNPYKLLTCSPGQTRGPQARSLRCEEEVPISRAAPA